MTKKLDDSILNNIMSYLSYYPEEESTFDDCLELAVSEHPSVEDYIEEPVETLEITSPPTLGKDVQMSNLFQDDKLDDTTKKLLQYSFTGEKDNSVDNALMDKQDQLFTFMEAYDLVTIRTIAQLINRINNLDTLLLSNVHLADYDELIKLRKELRETLDTNRKYLNNKYTPEVDVTMTQTRTGKGKSHITKSMTISSKNSKILKEVTGDTIADRTKRLKIDTIVNTLFHKNDATNQNSSEKEDIIDA